MLALYLYLKLCMECYFKLSQVVYVLVATQSDLSFLNVCKIMVGSFLQLCFLGLFSIYRLSRSSATRPAGKCFRPFNVCFEDEKVSILLESNCVKVYVGTAY